MQNENKKHVELLKQKIVATMQQSYPGINPEISEWKGQEITDFQEDLIIKTNANISEKWFYNHFKSESQKLPRIDVLNLLSKYAGYANWDDFIYKNSTEDKIKKTNRYFYIVPVLVLMMLGVLYLLFKMFSTREYEFSFYDAHTKELISNSTIEVKLLSDNEAPRNYLSDKNGNVSFRTDQSVIKMVINAPYYHQDTLTRELKRFDREQMISMIPDDYAMIIHFIADMNIEGWQQRRKYLDNVIDDAALIYQVYKDEDGPGMGLYNKEEFIDKLTMPSGNLKNIEVIDTRLKEEKIIILRYRINE